MQIIIRFPDQETEQRALGKLILRCSGKSWASGETAVPAQALSFLAEQGIKFTVVGPAPFAPGLFPPVLFTQVKT